MKIAVIKYNAGNIRSVTHALRRLGVEPEITDNERLIRNADKVIFPGVGEASTTMDYLRQRGLDKVIKNLVQPVLGICLGQQLLCRRSSEGDAECLGIFNVPVLKFEPRFWQDKVPHMGWNTIENYSGPLYKGFVKPEHVYFVHSYYVPVCQWTAAVSDYITLFSASLRKDNYFATQFHPEKSGDVGEKILKNFLDL